MQFSVLQPRAKQNMSCSYCAISAKFFPASCLGVLSPSVEALYSGSSSRMTNSRVFWLVHGIKQRVGHGSTSPTAQAGFGKLGGTSECVGFFQCCCAGMQGRAACSGVGLQPVCLSVWGFPHLGGGLGEAASVGPQPGSWEGTPTQVTLLKCCDRNKPVIADGFLYHALTTVPN